MRKQTGNMESSPAGIRTGRTRSGLFLLELIFAILFFSLCTVVCVRFFVKAHTLSEDTDNLNMAVNEASYYAEVFRSTGVLGDSNEDTADTSIDTMYYDKDWNPSAAEAGRFVITVQTDLENSMLKAEIAVTDLETSEELYKLTAEKYEPVGEVPYD